MQKLPEASDRKKGRHMRKEKGTSQQKEEAHSLSAVTGGVTTSKPPGCKWSQHGHSKVPRWANLSWVAAVSVNSMPKYKKLQNVLIELRTKILDLDKLPKVTNTLLKL